MKTTFANRELVHVWASQNQTEGKNSEGSLYFQGATIYSYGSHFAIAQFESNRKGETCVLFTTRSYSVTTAKHCGMVRSAIPSRFPVFHVPLTSDGFTISQSIAFLASYSERIKEATEAYAKCKAGNADLRLEQLENIVSEANDYCEFFGLTERFEVPSDIDAVKERLATERKERKAQELARKAQELEALKDRIEAWKAGGNETLPYSLDTVYMRLIASGETTCFGSVPVEEMEIETSKGARVPLSHAVALLAVVRRVVKSGVEWKRNGRQIRIGLYSVDRIESDGTLHAGCHHIAYSEIERLGNVLDTLVTVPAVAVESHTEGSK